MKRPTAAQICEQAAMFAVVVVFFIGLGFMADESDCSLETFLFRKIIGLGVFGTGVLLGRYFYRKGIIRKSQNEGRDL